MKDFLYIKPQKTACSSITRFLLPYTEPNNCKGFFITGYKQDIKHHLTYNQYIEYFGPEKLENVILFGTVRNPWDRWVSWWKFSHRNNRNHPETIPSLKTFLLEKPENHYLDFFEGAKDLHIIRFENLQQDFNIVCDKIGIPRQKLPHENKTKRKHYTEYYDNETRQIVAERYAKDIEYFDYKFGE